MVSTDGGTGPWWSDGHWTRWTSPCSRRCASIPGPERWSSPGSLASPGRRCPRLQRLEDSGVVTGYGPDVDVGAAGFGVQAFVTLEIAQGAIEDVQRDLEDIPGLLEAHATTGSGDVLCRVAASSHEGLQQILVELNRSPAVVRSTSVVALSQLVPWRTLPLLASEAAPGAGRSAMNENRDQR